MFKQQNLPLPNPKLERSGEQSSSSPLPNGLAVSSESLPSLASLEHHRSSPPRTEGAASSNEITTPSHVTVTSSNEIAGKDHSQVPSSPHCERHSDDPPAVDSSVNLEELQKLLQDSSKYPELLADKEEEAGCVFSKETNRLLWECEIELEKIDQECLELGPFAKDPKTGIREIDRLASLQNKAPKPGRSPPSQSTRRSRRTQRRRESKVSSKEAESPGVPLDKKAVGAAAAPPVIEVGRVSPPEQEKPAKEAAGPKKKWRKVGSGGKQSQPTDSTPKDILNLDSGIIPAASEEEMLTLYFPGHEDSLAHSPSPSEVQLTGSVPNSTAGDSHSLLSPRQLAPDGNLSQSSSSLVSEQDQGERAKAGSQQRETAKPQTAKPSPSTSTAVSTSTASRPFIIASSPSAQALVPVSQTGGYSSNESSPRSIHHAERIGSHKPHKGASRTGIPDSRPDKEPDFHNVVAVPSTQVSTRPPSVPKTGFSIVHLTSDTESTGGSPAATEEPASEQSRGGWIQERLTQSPSIASSYGEVESPLLNSLKKRRSSSSSSHRSLKQQSLDDGAVGKQPGSPFSVARPPRAHSASVVFHGDAESGSGAASPSPFQPSQDGKPPGMTQPLPGVSMPGINPYLWASPNQIPSESAGTSPLPRYPYPSPFLHSNWLQSRGPVLGSLHPFRPAAVFPGLDPNSPYKPMFGTPYLPYRYPFPPQGLKSPFPGATFPAAAASSAGSQPHTPSISAGFSFSQPSLYPLPVSAANPNLSAFRSLNDISNNHQSGIAMPPILQHPPFGGKEGKQQTPGANEGAGMPDNKVPPMGWMQPALLGANYGGVNMAYFGATPFNLGVQKQMAAVQGSISQASPVNIFNARLATPLSSSPLAITRQNSPGVPPVVESRSAERPPREQSDWKPLQRKSSAPNIDMTGQYEPVVKHPEHEPGSSLPFQPESIPAKLPQVMYGTDIQIVESSKWKPLQEASHGAAPVVLPSFIRAPSFPVTGTVLPYPVVCSAGSADSRSQLMTRPGHMIPSNPQVAGHMIPSNPQVAGHMILSNPQVAAGHMIPNNPQVAGHVMPMGYATPYTPPVPRGRLDSGSNGGKASPKNNSMKLRMHHVKDDDFKSQAKSAEKKRRRPWRGKGEKEGDMVDPKKNSSRLRRLTSDGDGKASGACPADSSVPGSSLPPTSQAGVTDAENYGLNILAACSSIQSKEHQKEEAAVVDSPTAKDQAPESISLQQQGGGKSQHPQLPSPVSLAGANTLLLLGKDAHGHQPATSTTAPSSVPVRVTAAESSVVDSLLELRASKPTTKQPPPSTVGQPQSAIGPESGEVGERSTRSASYSAAETMLMFAQDVTKGDGSNGDAVARGGGAAAGWREDFEVFENGKRAGEQQLHSPKSRPAGDSSPSTREADRPDRPEKLDYDSEATDTDSEATLSPDSPRMRNLESVGGMESGLKGEVARSEPSLTEAPPSQPELELESTSNQSPVQGAETEEARISPSPKLSPSPPNPKLSLSPPSPPSPKLSIVESEKEDSLKAPHTEEAKDTSRTVSFEEPSQPPAGETDTITEPVDTRQEERGNDAPSTPCPEQPPAGEGLEPATSSLEDFQESETQPESGAVLKQEPASAAAAVAEDEEEEDRLLGAPLPSPPPVEAAEDAGGSAGDVESDGERASAEADSLEATDTALQDRETPVSESQVEPIPQSHSLHPEPVPEPEPTVQPMETHFSPVTSPLEEPPPQQDSEMEVAEAIHPPQEPDCEVSEAETQPEQEDEGRLEDEPPSSKRPKLSPTEDPAPSQELDASPTAQPGDPIQVAGAASTDVGRALPDLQDIGSIGTPEGGSMGTPEGAVDNSKETRGEEGEIEPTSPPELKIIDISRDDDSEACKNEDVEKQEQRIEEAAAADTSQDDGVSDSKPKVAPTASPMKEESPLPTEPSRDGLPESPPVAEPPAHSRPESESHDGAARSCSEFSGEMTAVVEASAPADPSVLQTPSSSSPIPVPAKGSSSARTTPRASPSPAPVTQPQSAVDGERSPLAAETAKKAKLIQSRDRQLDRKKSPVPLVGSAGEGDIPPKSSIPAAPQNRLVIKKLGFDRFKHRKHVSAHLVRQGRELKREDNRGPGRKRPKPLADSQPWGPRGLFDVDPMEIRREKGEKRAVERPPPGEELLDERPHAFRKVKLVASRPPHGSGSLQRPPLSERSKHAPHARAQAPEDPLHRHSRSQQDGRGYARESGNPRSRQGSCSSSPAANHCDPHHPHSPGRVVVERKEFSPLSDDVGTAHPKHQRWTAEMTSEYHKEREFPPGKHRSGHKHHPGAESHPPPLRKQRSPGYEGQHPFKREWKGEKGGGPASSQGTSGPEKRKHRADAELLAPETARTMDSSSSKHGWKRRREEEGRLAAAAIGRDNRDRAADVRRKSYESISDEEVVFDSSRESSSVREDRRSSERRSSHESVPEYRGGAWRKDRKRRLSGSESEEEEEGPRAPPKHKKRKHKSHKEKWRKAEGNDHKVKWGSEDKHRHGYVYHKH